MYQTIQIDNISKMIPFFDFTMIEKISADVVRCNFLAIKVDHIKGVVFFGKQRIEAKELREHISLFAESLSKARTMISLLEL